MTVTPRPSADGKKVDFVAQGADGAPRVLASFDNTDTGKAQFLQRVMRSKPETKIGWIVESEKAKQSQANADRDFDLRKRETESQLQYRDRMLAIQQSQEARARATHGAAMQDAKIPPAVKLNAQALAEQIKAVDTALNKSMAEGMFDPNNPGAQKLIEQRATLSLQYQRLLTPYIPGAEKASADPLGLMGEQPAAEQPAQRQGVPQPRAASRPVAYDPALKTVVDALSPRQPAPTGAGTMEQLLRASQNQGRAITGR